MSFLPSDEVPYAQPMGDAPGPLAEDLYCLSCGYNLRGLAGDPIRCPECGDLNDRTALIMPAPLIKAALRTMETAPTLCVGAAFFLVFFGLTALVLVRQPLATGGSTVFAVGCAVVAAACAVAWPVACAHMRRSFDGRPGWARVLGGFHVAGMLLILWYPLLIAWAILLDRRWPPARGLGWIVLSISVLAFVCGLRVYAAARRRMARMRRDAAVRIAAAALNAARRRTGGRRRTAELPVEPSVDGTGLPPTCGADTVG